MKTVFVFIFSFTTIVFAAAALAYAFGALFYHQEKGDRAHLSLEEYLKLRKIAPDKWSMGWDNEIYYTPSGKKKDNSSMRVFLNTFAESLMLRHIEKKRKRNKQQEKAAEQWLKDIDAYQKKMREESDAEIEVASKDITDYCSSLRTAKIINDSIIASQMATADQIRLASLEEKISALQSRMGG